MKLGPQHLLLPFVWLNTLFGNQLWSATFGVLGQVFYWLSLLTASLIAAKAFGRWVWPYFLIVLVVGSRVAAILEIGGMKYVYMGLMMLLFAVAGVALALSFAHVLERQVRVFFALSLPLMFLQVVGAGAWLQSFNTLYITGGSDDPDTEILRPQIRLLPVLLASEDDLSANRSADFFEFLSMQARPPGLTHSSAMLGVFILAGAAVHLGRARGRKLTRHDVILACVAVMAGAKLALLGFLLLLIFALVRAGPVVRARLVGLMLVAVAALGVYVTLFPAVAKHNLGSGSFEVSFFTRAADVIIALAPDLAYLPELADVVTTYAAVLPDDREDVGGLSGMAAMIRALPFVLGSALLALPWMIRGFRYCRALSVVRCRTAELMLMVLLIVPFAIPLFGSQFYGICAGIALMPLTLSMSARLRTRIVEQPAVPPGQSVNIPPEVAT